MKHFVNVALAFFLIAASICAQTFPSTSAPRVIKTVRPAYTQQALEARLEGTVILAFTVDTDGIPGAISIVRGIGAGLDQKAIECLQEWRFEPARNALGAIAAKVRAEIIFRLPPPA